MQVDSFVHIKNKLKMNCYVRKYLQTGSVTDCQRDKTQKIFKVTYILYTTSHTCTSVT
jgi:hypothetical protein